MVGLWLAVYFFVTGWGGNMTKDEYLHKIRELIQAEIAAYAEAIEKDEDGYRGCSNKEQKNADKVFQELRMMA